MIRLMCTTQKLVTWSQGGIFQVRTRFSDQEIRFYGLIYSAPRIEVQHHFIEGKGNELKLPYKFSFGCGFATSFP